MAIRRPLRRVGTDLQACTDDDMIRLRYQIRRAYAKMVHGGDSNNVGLTSGKLSTALYTADSIGSTVDKYKNQSYNQGTGRWHPWPHPGGPYGYGPGADFPSAPGTYFTNTTVTCYQNRDWTYTNVKPSAPSASDMEHSYLVYDSTDGIVMETTEQNIVDTILYDCVEEMHGRSVGSSSGDGIGSYWLGTGPPDANFDYYQVPDGTVMVDRVYGNSNYGTYKLYLKHTHNYGGSAQNDGSGPGTSFDLLKESSGEIVPNPIAEGSDLVSKVLLPYLCRNLSCIYTLTTNNNYPGEQRGSATDHYYDSASTSYQGPGIWGSEKYRTYSTPSGGISAYTTYYLRLTR